jgi:hypothetical protein
MIAIPLRDAIACRTDTIPSQRPDFRWLQAHGLPLAHLGFTERKRVPLRTSTGSEEELAYISGALTSLSGLQLVGIDLIRRDRSAVCPPRSQSVSVRDKYRGCSGQIHSRLTRALSDFLLRERFTESAEECSLRLASQSVHDVCVLASHHSWPRRWPVKASESTRNALRSLCTRVLSRTGKTDSVPSPSRFSPTAPSLRQPSNRNRRDPPTWRDSAPAVSPSLGPPG